MTKSIARFQSIAFLGALSLFLTITNFLPSYAVTDPSQSVQEALKANAAGTASLKVGKSTEAEASFKQALALSEQLPDNNRNKDPLIATCCDNLALMYNDQAKYAEAEVLFSRSLSIRERLKGVSNASKILNLNNVATVLENQSKYSQELPLLKGVLSIAEQSTNKDDTGVAQACFHLAEVYRLSGNSADAELLHKRGLSIREKLVPESEETAASLNSLGMVYGERGLYQEAEPLFRRALAVREKLSGKESPTLAPLLSNLATVNGKMGRIDQAAALLTKALHISEIALGPEDLTVAAYQKNLGSVYAEIGRYDESIRLMKLALATREKKLGNENESVGASLNDLGILYQSQGKYSEAQDAMSKGLLILEKRLGPKHPDVARSLDSLGSVYLDEEKFDLAESFLNRALKIYEASFGANNPQVAQVMKTLADLKNKQNRYSEADDFYQKSAGIFKNSYGIDHSLYRNTSRNLVNTQISENKLVEAAALMEQILSIDQRLTGTRSALVASDLLTLSRIYQKQRKSQEQQDALTKAESIKKMLPGAPTAPSADHTRAPSITGEVGQKWALVIGVSNFKDPSMNLKYAAKDATDFSTYLVKNGHFKNDHVKLLTDDKATRQNIVDLLGDQWLSTKATKKDLLIIYVSSHGGKPMHDTGVNFLVPYDGNFRNLLTSGIPMEWLSQIIKDQIPCERVVLILDVCHSGAAATDQTDTGPTKGTTKQEDSGVNIAKKEGSKEIFYRKLNFDASKLSAGKGQFVMCSSQVNQRSWESKNYQNSVFTHWLIEGLKEKGATTTLGDAYDFMKMRVEDEVLRDRGEQQTPLIRKSWQGEEVVIGAQ